MDLPSLQSSPRLPQVTSANRQPTWSIHSGSDNYKRPRFPAKFFRQNLQVLHKLPTLRQSITNSLSLRSSLPPSPRQRQQFEQMTKVPHVQTPLSNKRGGCLYLQEPLYMNPRARTPIYESSNQFPAFPHLVTSSPGPPNQEDQIGWPPVPQLSVKPPQTSPLDLPQRSAAQLPSGPSQRPSL